MAIPGEGRIGAIESALLPLSEGPAYFALRSRVPLVPIAINGTSWIGFGGRVRVRVGEPIVAVGPAGSRATSPRRRRACTRGLEALVADAPGRAAAGASGAG